MRIRALALLSFCVTLLLAAPVGAGAETYPPGTASLSDAEITERMDFLAQRFKSEQAYADLWEYGWGGFNVASAAWSGYEFAIDNNYKDRNTDLVQTVESLIGVADVVFRPLPNYNADAACPKTPTTPEERRACLAAEETIAEEAAARADQPYEVLPHLGNLVFNLAAGAIVWRIADFHHAFMTAVPGEVVGEAQLWTIPQGPTDSLNAYKLQFAPLVIENDKSHAPTTGLRFIWSP